MAGNITASDILPEISNATVEALRAKFGPPGSSTCPDNATAATAVALMQLSLRYFAETGAPKEVVEDFFNMLMRTDEQASSAHAPKKSSILIPHLSLVKP